MLRPIFGTVAAFVMASSSVACVIEAPRIERVGIATSAMTTSPYASIETMAAIVAAQIDGANASPFFVYDAAEFDRIAARAIDAATPDSWIKDELGRQATKIQTIFSTLHDMEARNDAELSTYLGTAQKDLEDSIAVLSARDPSGTPDAIVAASQPLYITAQQLKLSVIAKSTQNEPVATLESALGDTFFWSTELLHRAGPQAARERVKSITACEYDVSAYRFSDDDRTSALPTKQACLTARGERVLDATEDAASALHLSDLDGVLQIWADATRAMGVLHVTSASYGNADVTSKVASAMDWTSAGGIYEYKVDSSLLGDPQYEAKKAFRVTYRCESTARGRGDARTVTLAAEANGHTISLKCW